MYIHPYYGQLPLPHFGLHVAVPSNQKHASSEIMLILFAKIDLAKILFLFCSGLVLIQEVTMDIDTTNGTHCTPVYDEVFTQTAYQGLLLVPIYIIVAFCYLLTFIITVLRLILWKKEWNFAKKFREADRKMIAYMLETFFNMLHHREGIRELENEVITIEHSTGEKNQMKEVQEGEVSSAGQLDNNAKISHSTVIDTDEILRSQLAMNILSWYVANISSLALVIFWDVFILKESHYCDNELECFYKNHTYIPDCGCLTSEDQYGVLCYDVTLEFPMAIAEVAGILFLALNGFSFLMFLKLLIADGITSRCLKIMLYLSLAAIEYLIVLGIIGAFVARTVLLQKEDSTNTIIEEVLISIAMIMGVTTPWIMLLWATRKVIRRKNAAKTTNSETS